MNLLPTRALLVQLMMVASTTFHTRVSHASGSARIPTTFTRVQNRHCRFRYTVGTSSSAECNTAGCWINSNIFRQTELTQPLPLQKEVCVLDVPSKAYDIRLYAPLERVDFLSPNCSWDVLKHYTTIYKILANGSRINIKDHENQYQFTISVGNPSDLWCESPNLQPVPDPYKDHCSIVLHIPSPKILSKYAGTWQMLFSFPTTNAELVNVYELYVKVTDWPCDVCFGAQSTCVKLNFDDFYHSGLVSLERQAKMPTYSVPQGEPFCVVLQSSTDINGSWVYVGKTTSLTAEPLLYFDRDGHGTMVSANTINGVSLYGEYHNCLHIDQMRDALDGLFMYQHSGYYAATHNNSGLAVIRVQLDEGDHRKPAESRIGEYLGIGFGFFVVLLIILVTAVHIRKELKTVKETQTTADAVLSSLQSYQQGSGGSSAGGPRPRQTITSTDEEGLKV